MTAESMSLWEDGPYGNGPSYATIFLGYWNQPSTKEVWSDVLWDELVVGSYPLLLHSLQMALTASEFICLMMSALHPVRLLLSSALHF